MRLLLLLVMMFSATAFAEVSREEASGLIDEMVNTQMISKEEAEKAKARLVSMSDAEVVAARMPASVIESESTDLSQEQFQAIQNDLAVIAPHYISGR